MLAKSVTKRNLTMNFLIVLSLLILFQISIFNYLKESVHVAVETIPLKVLNFVILFVFSLNILTIVISIIITGLVAYFFGKILNAEASKKTFIYIISTATIVVYLINIPLAIANFINQDNTQIIMLKSPVLMLLNPLIYISLYILYKLLRKYTKLNKKIIIGYCSVFYILKLVGIIISQLQLVIN